MATYHEITSSDPVKVTDTDVVAQLLNQYEFHVETVKFNDETGELGFYGAGSPDPYRRFPNATEDELIAAGIDPDDLWHGTLDPGVPHAFYWRLTQYIEPGDELVVQTVGNEKARYVAGYQYRVTHDTVRRRTLNKDEHVVKPEPHSPTSVVENEDTLFIETTI